jgi:hypothetical protein
MRLKPVRGAFCKVDLLLADVRSWEALLGELLSAKEAGRNDLDIDIIEVACRLGDPLLQPSIANIVNQQANSFLALYAVARSCILRFERKRAIRVLEECLACHESEPCVWLWLAFCYSSDGDLRAEEYLMKASTCCLRSIQFIVKGDLCAAGGDFAEAKLQYEAAGHVDPASIVPWIRVGSMSIFVGDFVTAAASATRALAIDRSAADAWSIRSAVEHHNGRFIRYLACLDKVTSCSRNRRKAVSLALAHLGLCQFRRAWAVLAKLFSRC